MKKIHWIISILVFIIICGTLCFADIKNPGVPPIAETWLGIKTFMNGFVVKDANTIVADPNGGLRAKYISVNTAVDPNIPLCINKSGIATTSTSGIVLQNTTASTVGVPVQYSPNLSFYGSGWNTNTSTNVLYKWTIRNSPVSQSSNYSRLNIAYSENNGAESINTFLDTNGTFYSYSITGVTGFLSYPGIASTSTDCSIIRNTTASTAGVPVQMSPRLRLSGTVWNTTGAGSNETSSWIIENLPTSGTTPSSLLKFGYSANGAAYSYPLTVSNNGTINQNSLSTYKASVSLADDATVTLPTITTGGMLKVWCSTEYAEYFIASDGSVSYIRMSLNCDDIDNDTFLCCYDGGSTAIIKNRLGGTRTVGYILEYN